MIIKDIRIATWIESKTNCYLIFDEDSKEIMVIDPAGDADKIENAIKEEFKGNLKYIYITHCHGDHIAGVNDLKSRCGGKILIHKIDAKGLNDRNINLYPYPDLKPIILDEDSKVEDGDLINLGKLEFKVIHTPGHTAGSTSLYCQKEKCLFSGDTIFAGAYGRTDLPTSSKDAIIDSIFNKIFKLPDETIIYPGHGRTTILKNEKNYWL